MMIDHRNFPFKTQSSLLPSSIRTRYACVRRLILTELCIKGWVVTSLGRTIQYDRPCVWSRGVPLIDSWHEVKNATFYARLQSIRHTRLLGRVPRQVFRACSY